MTRKICLALVATFGLTFYVAVSLSLVASRMQEPVREFCIPAIVGEMHEVEFGGERFLIRFGEGGNYWACVADDFPAPKWEGSWSTWKSKRSQCLWLRVCECQDRTGRVCVWETPLRCQEDGTYRGVVFYEVPYREFAEIVIRPLKVHEG